MATHTFAHVDERLGRIERWAGRGKKTKEKMTASGVLAPVREWVTYMKNIASRTDWSVAFKVGHNPLHQKFQNLEAVVTYRGAFVEVPGFLRYSTNDPLATVGHVRASTSSWCSRVGGATVTPVMPGFDIPPGKSRDALITFPSSFDLGNTSTHPGFQTIQTTFIRGPVASSISKEMMLGPLV